MTNSADTLTLRANAVAYLARMRAKAADKGEDPICGAKTTREIAEHIGVSARVARSLLVDLSDAQEIMWVGHDSDGSHLWSAPRE